MERCHYILDHAISRIHIPGCMGAAVYGPSGCTCPEKRASERMVEVEDRLTVIERSLAVLVERSALPPAPQDAGGES